MIAATLSSTHILSLVALHENAGTTLVVVDVVGQCRQLALVTQHQLAVVIIIL